MAAQIQISGSKDDVVELLEGKRQEHLARLRNLTGPAKAREEGEALGLLEAIETLRQWDWSPNGHAGTPAIRAYSGEQG